MDNVVGFVLTPITVPMDYLLSLYTTTFNSAGLGIIALSATFSTLMMPISAWAHSIERRASEKSTRVKNEIALQRGNLRGEALFDLTEKIYRDQGYHPIQSIMTGLSIIVMLPILISSIIVITSSTLLNGTPFLFMGDLSKPDGLFLGLNALPIILISISIIDAFLRFPDNGQRIKALSITAVLTILVYNLASGLVLYWISNNVYSLILNALSGNGSKTHV